MTRPEARPHPANIGRMLGGFAAGTALGSGFDFDILVIPLSITANLDRRLYERSIERLRQII